MARGVVTGLAPKTCEACQQAFTPNHPRALYCSRRCRDAWYAVKQHAKLVREALRYAED